MPTPVEIARAIRDALRAHPYYLELDRLGLLSGGRLVIVPPREWDAVTRQVALQVALAAAELLEPKRCRIEQGRLVVQCSHRAQLPHALRPRQPAD